MYERVEDMIERHEGRSLVPYKCTAGKLTIGVGRNLEARGISDAVANLMLQEDIELCIDQLGRFPWYAELDEVRRNAMIDMVFNLGITRFSKFKKMIAAMKNKDYFEASMQAKDSAWYNQVGNRAVEVCAMIRHGG